MAENRTWSIGDRVLFTDGGGDLGESVKGTVYELRVEDGKQFIRIMWDDGQQDSGWWSANDSELTPLTTTARERLSIVIRYLPLSEEDREALVFAVQMALNETAKFSVGMALTEGERRGRLGLA